ncbi:MAG: class I SAM-dependent methyltransferase [Cytophagales bacterium]|nr:class I SAM-dependent methyltransferase [Cytophagales bacterium]
MKDNFSKQADGYAKFRPHYPTELYQYLFEKVKPRTQAWDCGTGNGQVAIRLAEEFGKVYATDISQAQLDRASKADNIEYRVAPAEDSTLPPQSVDLITVAQAIHWFDMEQFHREIQRVAKPQALVAYWAYSLPKITAEIDEVVLDLHDNVLGPYWDLEREIWRGQYGSIALPLQNKEKRDFQYHSTWTYEHLEGYLNSWSSVQHYIAKTGTNPVPAYLQPIKQRWKDPKKLVFPIFLYSGVV